MTRNKKNSEKPGVALDGARPGRDGRPMPADLQAHIGVRLKAFYDSVLSEPIPDRFAELLNKLDAAERPAGDGRAKSDGDLAASRDDTETDMRS